MEKCAVQLWLPFPHISPELLGIPMFSKTKTSRQRDGGCFEQA